MGISVDETTTPAVLADVAAAFGATLAASVKGFALEAAVVRTSDYLQHPVFNTHRSETQLLRYIRRLSDRDLALDRTMIPLGSCTMKLNATAEMEAISWPEFASIHPFAPDSQTEGWRELIDRPGSGPRPRSPATTRSPSSRTPARRASSPACSRSAATTCPAVMTSATSA